jgi:uncharacterized damage-inducible protein DinB
MIGTIALANEPSEQGNERDTLIGMLDYYRSVLLRKAAGLTQAELATRLAPSTLTLGGLLKHAAFVEDQWFNDVWAGGRPVEPWASVDWKATPDWDLDSAAADSPRALQQLFEESVTRSRAAISDDLDLDRLARGAHRRGAINLRWILVHMIEEYARHCGHADLIRESIDGATND